MKHKKTLSNWLTTRYLLIVRSEENFAEKRSFNFTYAKLIVFLILLFLLYFIISFYLQKSILALNPEKDMIGIDKKIVALSAKVDSLEEDVYKKDLFIKSFKNMLDGGLSEGSDTSKISPKVSHELVDPAQISKRDSLFRKHIEEEELSLISNKKKYKGDLSDISFYSPADGVIERKFAPEKGLLGISLATKEESPVKCIADGTVIFDYWTSGTGYVLGVQHRNHIISIYKNNSGILKKTGNFVKAGEVLAFTGKINNKQKPMLEFEMWHKGNPVNPENYISF